MNLIKATWRSYFGPHVAPGQVWMIDDDDPFLDDRFKYKARVLEVKDGYVKFVSSMKVRSFESVSIGVFRFHYRLTDLETEMTDLSQG